MSNYYLSIDKSCNVLVHHGVKGMKWGVRHDGVPRSTRRTARKDAKEYARAKMYYGEGAGNRRKLIKATVNQRSKDPAYKKAFDDYSAKQDMAKHASGARRERKRNDAKVSVARTSRGIVNIATGHPERVGAALAGAAMLYGVAQRTGATKIVARYAASATTKVANGANVYRGRKAAEAFLHRNGL